MKRAERKNIRGILAWMGLLMVLPLLGGMACAPKNLGNPALLPRSQDTTEVRTSAPYILDVGDEMSITVWGFDGLKQTATVDNSGEITLPMLGTLKVAGKTVPKIREMMTAGFKKYIVDPQVIIAINAALRQQILVFGEVTSPSVLTYRRPLKLMEAIARAGWFNRDANTKTVLLIRRAQGKYHVMNIDTGQIFQNGTKSDDFYLQSGDLVYVSPKGIVKIERFLQHIQTLAQPFLTVEQAVVLWPQFVDALQGKTPTTGLSISTPTGTSTSSTSTSSTTSTSTTSSTTSSQ